MAGDTTRVLIESIVRKALRDIQDSPERTVRNLVDMAQHFAKGRFQQHFFEAAQRLLENENSPYYALVQDVAHHVDPDRLMAFGINVGYNGCTLGAKTIRETEEAEGYNIPWAITLHLKSEVLNRKTEHYQRTIAKGERLGIHTWFLVCHDEPLDALELVSAHPASAFVMFFPKEYASHRLLEQAMELKHLMLAVQFDENDTQLCTEMREMGMLYAVYDEYTDDTAADILSGERIWAIQQLHPHITVLIGAAGCHEKTKHQVYRYVAESREKHFYQTIPWEFTLDNRYVDTVISGDACSAGFTSSGQLYTLNEIKQNDVYSLFGNDLSDILKKAFPKERNGHD